MEEKRRVLLEAIADLVNDSRKQDYYIEELTEERDQALGSEKGLREEKIQAGETYHKAIVEKNATINQLETELEAAEAKLKKAEHTIIDTSDGKKAMVNIRELALFYNELIKELTALKEKLSGGGK
jgi:uncharacterized coiled-coil DUF342 family protein